MRQADTNQESLAVVTLTTDAAEVQATVLPVRWRGNGAPPQQLTEAVQVIRGQEGKIHMISQSFHGRSRQENSPVIWTERTFGHDHSLRSVY